MTGPGEPGHVAGTSVNERAERLLGCRDEDGPIGIVLFEPVELAYRCPVHTRTLEHEELRQTLFWSEYRAFLWCELCDCDYPSALCLDVRGPNAAQHAITVYLDTVEQAILRDRARHDRAGRDRDLRG